MYFIWIEKQANYLLREYSGRTGWLREPPVPVSLIAEICYDVAISYEELSEDIAGELFLNERLIRINANDGPERQNFTIGHELGHLRLHVKNALKQLSLFDEQPSKPIICRRNDRKAIEREANAFSANLLMPQRLVVNAYRNICQMMRNMPSQQKVAMMYDERWRDSLLAKKFDVSLEAMRYRLINLKLINNVDQYNLEHSLESHTIRKRL